MFIADVNFPNNVDFSNHSLMGDDTHFLGPPAAGSLSFSGT